MQIIKIANLQLVFGHTFLNIYILYNNLIATIDKILINCILKQNESSRKLLIELVTLFVTLPPIYIVISRV